MTKDHYLAKVLGCIENVVYKTTELDEPVLDDNKNEYKYRLTLPF